MNQLPQRLDFTPDKLRPILLELANLYGYQSPVPYLDELLNKVKLFNDHDFECCFILNIHNICKDNSGKFWNNTHRIEISNWLKTRSEVLGVFANVFDSTWTGTKPKSKRDKAFPEYLLHSKKISLAKGIKKEFGKEKSKTIRLLIEALKSSNLLTIGYGKESAFYRALKEAFDSNIGSHNSIFNYPYDKKINEKDLEVINKRLQPILDSMLKLKN